MRTHCFALATFLACPATVLAQRPHAVPGLVDSLAALIRTEYVFVDRAERVAGEMTRMAGAGRFMADTTPAAFAAAVTREIRLLMDGDGHFLLVPPTDADQQQPVTRGVRGSPSFAQTRMEAERRQGYFFRRIESLPGNVLLIVLDQFPFPSPEAIAAATGVMHLAAGADAVIIDLRLNNGGSEGYNQYLASHFFPADTTKVLYRRYQRDGDRTVATTVLGTLPASRNPTAPLYILTSGGTVSAAENFAYTLQQHGRATVVGERSRGAANSSRFFPLPGGYSVQMPVARVIHPVSGTNWEETGVTPDVIVPPTFAVDSAYALALRALMVATADSSRRDELGSLLGRLEVIGAPPSAATLEEFGAYVGRYAGGTREVRVEGWRLVTQIIAPQPGATIELRPRGGDEFLMVGLPGNSTPPVRFIRDANGQVVQMHVFLRSGQWGNFPRDP